MTFKERLGIVSTAARKLHRMNPRYEVDELVSEAYVRGGMTCSEVPGIVYKACMMDMLNFLESERKDDEMYSLETMLELHPELVIYEHRSSKQIDDLDEINFLFKGTPYKDRLLVYLRYWTTCTASEIADKLRITRNRVRVSLSLALKKVRTRKHP